MATATHVLLSLEDYLRTSYHPDREYVDGCLQEKALGEREHSVLQIALGAWFFNRRVEWKVVVMSEQRTRVSPNRVRLPDLCLVSRDAPFETVTVTPPLLAIELLSREDRMNRVLVRLHDLLAMGITNIWLIDPVERVAYTYTTVGLQLTQNSRLSVPDSPIYLDLPELFSALD